MSVIGPCLLRKEASTRFYRVFGARRRGRPRWQPRGRGRRMRRADLDPCYSCNLQAEKGAVTETRETTKTNENLEFGGSIAGFGLTVMVAWYFLPPGDRGAHNLRYIIPLLLGLTCLISGFCLMLLSMNLLELPQRLVSESQLMVSKYLPWLCSALPVITLIDP